MEIPNRTNESLLNYAEILSDIYSEAYSCDIRKVKGQILTSDIISKFMADLFEINKNEIYILDPGAGTGILTAAFCERILECDDLFNLKIDAYENDPDILPFLKMVLKECKKELESNGRKLVYNIYNNDFILSNRVSYANSTLYGDKNDKYDFVISNPPYFKIRKESEHSRAMKDIVYGQPNIYTLFMALATNMTKINEELVFIVPRSFCSGLYYRKFREWFLDKIEIKNIHIFESRNEIFERDKILQENIIIRFKRANKKNGNNVTITVSRNGSFNEINEFEVPQKYVIYKKFKDVFIRIPTSISDAEILHIVDKWPKVLKDLNLEISTGPVVPFRCREYLQLESNDDLNTVPLLWMHNIQDMKVKWPYRKNKKESAIISSKTPKSLLLPVKNYVLVGRFSSKEQDRRLYAGVLFKSDFNYDEIGIENHLNYIHRPEGDISEYEAVGIASLLNTRIVDNFFRSINGNTQVNATEIRVLPLPTIEDIKKIGEEVALNKENNLDKIVGEILEIDSDLIRSLNGD